MRYGNIKYFDVANGSGVRTSLFVSGCYRHCPGCFSPETWSFEFGNDFTEEVQQDILDSLKPSYIAGLSVLGGEPMENRDVLILFLRRVKEQYPEKDVWLFTGYDWTEITALKEIDSSMEELLALVDVLKVGSFEEELYDPSLQFCGSRNQEIIDMNKTRENGDKVLWNGGDQFATKTKGTM